MIFHRFKNFHKIIKVIFQRDSAVLMSLFDHVEQICDIYIAILNIITIIIINIFINIIIIRIIIIIILEFFVQIG